MLDMNKEIEIPEGYEARIKGNKVIFEPKEPEDERIRKELLEEIEFIIPHDDETDSEGLMLPSYHARIDRYKSYLEKQKEQKPEEWKPQPESLEALMYAIEGKWEMIKPTSYLSRRLEDLYDGLVNTFDVDESLVVHENDFVSKPANATQTDAKKNANAEWTEEDDNALNYIHELISFGFTENFMDAQTAADMREWLNTQLKSIRPSWKPSEEQMKCLKDFVSKVRDIYNAYNVYTNRYDAYPTLKSLYNDLKKLI